MWRAAGEARTTAEQLKVSFAEIGTWGALGMTDLAAVRHESVQLQRDLEAAMMDLAATRQQSARLKGDLQVARADLAAASQKAERLERELQAAMAQKEQAIRALSEQLAVVGGRTTDIEARLAAILASSSWRLTQPLRTLLGRSPGPARLLRRAAKLVWWTVTLQLSKRLQLWRRANAQAGVMPSPLPRAPSSEGTVGPNTTLAVVLGRIEALEQRATTLDSLLKLERGRIDWALGGIEGVTAQIDDYHAYRETEEYRAAYATTTPLVSVCVATMDRAELLLERSIASVRAQSYRNLQIVVVGDNCTDDTARRLAALDDDRIQFVNLTERGPYPRPGIDRWYVAGSNAMNHALSLCEGQFITHLDDDDAMVPHRIERLVTAALESQADFLWHPFWCENHDGTWTRLGDGLFELGQVTTSSIFYHRYFARLPWDARAYRLREPGDWNRLRKIRLLRPRQQFVDEPLLYHHAEHSQATFVARDGERFLE